MKRGVLGIGLTSLFSDWSHEAATAILPAFLGSLGAPAVALGVIEGVSDGLSSFAKLAGGFLADRPIWRKPAGVVGYLATALTTFGYAFAQRWPAVLAWRAFGWMGRGSRGPSRDTLLADAVPAGQEGRAFGFERAMDALGAVLGPFSATLLLGWMGLRGVLRWTLLPGLVAVLSFVFLVPSAKRSKNARTAVTAPRNFLANVAQLPQNFWYFLAGVFAHGIGNFAPTLLILRATQILTPGRGLGRAAAISVGLYTFHNLIDAAASYPAGALGDRIDKRGLLAAGYMVGVVTYAGFIFAPPTITVLTILFGLAGVHDAFQQSLEKSLAAQLLPKGVRGSGFGVLAAANGVGDLVSSIVVGALWSAIGPVAGFLYAGIFVAVGAVIVSRSPRRRASASG
jgi:MFS family permease